MRRTIFASLVAFSAILLVSFTASKPEIRKIADKRYKIKDMSGMSADDKAIILNDIKKYYRISDFSSVQKIDFLPSDASTTSLTVIFEKKICVHHVDEKAIYWDRAGILSREDEKA